MVKSTTLRNNKRGSVPAINAERMEQFRDRLDELLRARREFLDKHGSANDVTSALGLTPITGRSGPRMFY